MPEPFKPVSNPAFLSFCSYNLTCLESFPNTPIFRICKNRIMLLINLFTKFINDYFRFYSSMKEEALKYHETGKIGISVSKPLKDKNDLSLAYTPGVAEVCLHIKDNPSAVFDYTLKKNTVAIISDGSRVLGLGKIGAEAAIPVMEGKAMIFKKMANIDAFPICIKTQDKDEFINIVKNISPVFGGINLEDIEVPKCFEIEEALQGIGIPVMHDDQHGTAIVALAGLLNAAKVAKKDLDEMKIVVNGAGAAGSSIVKLLK